MPAAPAVLAYGNTRELVLGVEVVLASGEVWNGLRKLRKDNTGYDLRDLFIGAEGTLGIITAAVLRLFPKPRGRSVAFVGAAATRRRRFGSLDIAKAQAASGLTAFELIPRIGIDVVLRHVPGTRDPLAGRHAWYVLMEVSSSRSRGRCRDGGRGDLRRGRGRGLVEDGVRARSLEQANAFWRIRHALSEVQKQEGGSIKHDVAVPVAAVPEFIARAGRGGDGADPGRAGRSPSAISATATSTTMSASRVGMDKDAFLARWDEVNAVVHAIVGELWRHDLGRARHRPAQARDAEGGEERRSRST